MTIRLAPMPPVRWAATALLALTAALAPACKSTDCGEGTTERNGVCEPASETFATAKCGPFTELRGDSCAPMLPPTVCDSATTTEQPDSAGVKVCIGTGGGGCSAKLACPAPTDGKHTICGQIYDFETHQPYAAPGATGARCSQGAASGPCALGLRAYDAVAFAMNPSTLPLTTDPLYVDDCGRFRISEIPVPTAELIAVGLDDAMVGPGGLTNAVGVATAAKANQSTELDSFVVRKSTSDGWQGAGTPNIGTGFYVPVFFGHRAGIDAVPGVTVTFGPMNGQPPTTTDAARDFYYNPDASARVSLNAGANTTGLNGTAMFSDAKLTELYSGTGGALPATCRWDIHGGASTPGVVFIQIFRPINVPGMTCPL